MEATSGSEGSLYWTFSVRMNGWYRPILSSAGYVSEKGRCKAGLTPDLATR